MVPSPNPLVPEDGNPARKRAFSAVSSEESPPPPSSPHVGSSGAGLGGGSYRTRPIRSCTHCRQQKIKCDASNTYPGPCTRCRKMDRECRVDPYFKPQKGGQVQSLRDDLSTLKQQVEYLQRRESALEGAIAKTNPNHQLLAENSSPVSTGSANASVRDRTNSSPEPYRRQTTTGFPTANSVPQQQIPFLSPRPDPLVGTVGARSASVGTPTSMSISAMLDKSNVNTASKVGSPSVKSEGEKSNHSPGNITVDNKSPDSPAPKEYVISDVKISPERAEELHERFMTKFLPYLPIIHSNSALELYQQSELLFWTVCLTASLSEPEPSLYNSLSGVIKQLAIETCWIHTPRSTHIVQALIILANWPIPNEKVLDDCSYRFIGLAKFLGMQLGLHRGKFIYEFSRTQVSLPDAENGVPGRGLLCFSRSKYGALTWGCHPTRQLTI